MINNGKSNAFINNKDYLKEMGYFMPGESEAISVSLFTGMQSYGETLWPWYLLLMLVVPVILGFAGGYQSQKHSSDKGSPWKNAVSFSSCYTMLFIAVVLVSQIIGNLDMSNAASLLGMMGEQVPGKAHLIIGFPVIKSLLTIGVVSILTALTGAYYASYHESN